MPMKDDELKPEIKDDELKQEINAAIGAYLQARLLKVSESLDVKKLLKKCNPYRLKANNIRTAEAFIKNAIDAHLIASEEEAFGHVFEHIGLYIVRILYNGKKSDIPGIDYEFKKDGILILVQHKSSWVWGNKAQVKALCIDFAEALLKYPDAKCYNLCSYGHHRKKTIKGTVEVNKQKLDYSYEKMTRSDTWNFLYPEDPNFHSKIIDAIDQDGPSFLKSHAEYNTAYKAKVDEFVQQLKDFGVVKSDGSLDWVAILNFKAPRKKTTKKPKKTNV